MIAATRLLAAWLTPALWLVLAAALMEGGIRGLWLGLLAVVGPLLALAAARAPAPAPRGSGLAGVALVLTATLLLWANLVLAGEAAALLGAPRWHGIALAAGLGVLCAAWRALARAAPLALLAAAVALTAPLVLVARDAGLDPLAAWGAVATRPSFVFPASSPWVTRGRALGLASGPDGLTFREEHRVTAASPGVVRARTRDGATVTEREWDLRAGEAIVLRPGDRLEPVPGARLRFQLGKRVPGAPESGVAWAAGGRADPIRELGLAVTLLGGALGLLGADASRTRSRAVAWLLGGGLLGALLLAEAWALYAALRAPDLFLGGVSAARLLEAPLLALGPAWGPPAQTVLGGAALAAFAASSGVLPRILAASTPGRPTAARDPGLWAAVFAAAALGSLWPAEAETVLLGAFGLAASTLAPVHLLGVRADRAWAATAAGAVGLACFALLAAAGLAGVGPAWVQPLTRYPALAAGPVAVAVLWLARGGAAE